MKKTKHNSISTDYFFESIFKKMKALILSNIPSKVATLKVFAIVSWFKEIN
jgi:hypothetical protein